MRQLILPITALALTLMCGGFLVSGQLSQDSINRCIRWTANSSFVLLCAAFSARALRDRLGDRWQALLTARRRLGLAFALSHTFHLAAILLLVYHVFEGDFSQLGDIRAGAALYVIIYAMALTSNDWSVRQLGASNWKRLHAAGGYILLIAFTGNQAISALQRMDYHWIYTLLGAAVLLLRLLPGRNQHA